VELNTRRATGLKNLSAASEQVASDRRACRHAASQANSNRACLSPMWQNLCFRLHIQQYNVMVEIDWLLQAIVTYRHKLRHSRIITVTILVVSSLLSYVPLFNYRIQQEARLLLRNSRSFSP